MNEPRESPVEGSNPDQTSNVDELLETPGAPASTDSGPGGDAPGAWDAQAAEAALAAARETAAKVKAALDRADAGMAASGPDAVVNDVRGVVRAFDASVDNPESLARVRRGGYHLAGLMEAMGLLPASFALALADGVADFIAPPGGEG